MKKRKEYVEIYSDARDTFANVALNGMLTGSGYVSPKEMPKWAAIAYDWADAMVAERAKRRKRA